MTDRQAILDMLERSRITHMVREDGSIVVEDGYAGFYTLIEFSDDGGLRRVSAWE